MTFSRHKKLVERWGETPPPQFLLTCIAAAHGYKPPPPKPTTQTLADQAAELKSLFPGGKIKGTSSG